MAVLGSEGTDLLSARRPNPSGVEATIAAGLQGTPRRAALLVARLWNRPAVPVLKVDAATKRVLVARKNPDADNKDTFSATGTFPVQNGKALFSLNLTATFQPDGTPPMRVEWSNLSVIVSVGGVAILTYP